MADDPNKPLQGRKRKARLLPRLLLRGMAALVLVALAGFAGWAVLVDDPLGGEPVAVVSTKPEPTPPPPTQKAEAQPAKQDGQVASIESSPAGMQTVTIIDGMSGKRQQVTIPSGGDAGKPASGAAGPQSGGGIEAGAAEPSRHGAIPKIAANGLRPSQLYAQQVAQTETPGAPRIAIVVGKLGVNASLLSEAFAKLPGPITFAFTPYGTDLDRWVRRARGEGHEVLLQVPMEPFDYPDNDPGPQTLLTSLSPEQNVDRLHWAMSRFGGYVGLSNFMGARFSTNEQGVSTVVGEAAKRGLIYFDDGGSTRSVTGQLAGARNVPFARADIVLDAVATPAEIEGALAKLEAVARERGTAVGFATALPVSIERISKWAKAAAARGVVLIPVSAAAGNKGRSS